jgi:hypothetical protein
MEIYYRLYVSESLKEKKARILRRLKKNRLQPGLYLLAFEKRERPTLEIFLSLLLKQELLRKKEWMIVGIASGYDEALELVRDLTEQVYQNTGGTDICAYVLNEQAAYKEGKRQV